MFLRAAIFLVAVLAPAIAVAAPVPPPPILKLTNAIVHASKTDDASGLASIYTNDAVVVDENAPFTWRGPGAGVAWWHVVDAVTRKAHLTHLNAGGIRIGEYQQSGSDAYLVEAMTITAMAGTKPFAESGYMTYTFHNTGGAWLISSQVWTTKP